MNIAVAGRVSWISFSAAGIVERSLKEVMRGCNMVAAKENLTGVLGMGGYSEQLGVLGCMF